MSWSVVIILSAIVIIGNSDKIIPQPQTREVQLSYTGNMGVLISSGKVVVWIDGLHEYYKPDYLHTPEHILQKAFAGENEFGRLKLVLFSHFHSDHFSSALTSRFLQKRKGVIAVGSKQVADSLQTSEIIIVNGRNGEIFSEGPSALRVKSFDIPHTWPQRHARVQNQAYLVELEGIRILHTGDADTHEKTFEMIRQNPVDVMIVPLWFLTGNTGMRMIRQAGAKKVIVTHIAPHSVLRPIKIPGIELNYFSQTGDMIRIPCR